MAKHRCKKCNNILTQDNCYYGWFKRSIFICKDCERLRKKQNRVALKIETISQYGGLCACCGEKKIEFLTIDHIDGNGAEHRKSIGLDYGSDEKTVAGHNFYRWLKNNNYPKDNYQVLCFNCNYAKHVYGVCPHRKQ